MARSLYLVPLERHAGTSLLSLGILDYVLRKTRRVAIFRPVIRDEAITRPDKTIDLLLRHFRLDQGYDETYALTAAATDALLAHSRYDELLNRIIAAYQRLAGRYDFVYCMGSDSHHDAPQFEFNLNVEMARSLDSPVILLASGQGRGVEELAGMLRQAHDAFRARGCPVVALVVNKVEPERLEALRASLARDLELPPDQVVVLPADVILASPTMREVVEQLNAEVLYGREQLDRQARRVMIVAMQMEHYLERLSDHALLVTPGDRGDILLSAVLAHHSANYPSLAGIVLTAGQRPSAALTRLLDGVGEIPPVVAVTSDTYETATELFRVKSYITTEAPTKIEAALQLCARYIDGAALEQRYGTIAPRGVSPRLFLYNLTQKARSNRRRIVLPEGNEERILRASAILVREGIADLILLGNPQEIRAMVSRLGIDLDLDQVTIIDPVTSTRLDAYADELYRLRQHRGMTRELARDLMLDVSYYGTMMVHMGDADGMVSGAAHTTAHTIRPALQIIKTRPGISIVSSVFFMCLEDRVLVYGDCAINPRPTAEQLADIAIASADTAKLFGIEPRVAMLSYSTGESGEGEEVERVRKATRLAQVRRPDLLLEGPLQYDAAVDETVARTKMPDSRVAGRATVLIFPDLNTGNNTYKAVQRETGSIAVGPVLQGLNKPVNDLSRGCSVEDIVNTVAITAVQAQEMLELTEV
ncbi:MAG: phosphate acetyltransferase [Oscillochloridaceae bacterium]|nr:phosphate acetyltransferase [Chloroflexaceae bacterium]MDW8388596.1 phosphate acetyltransferase [Oscillochloridaceae bacterium]